MLALARCAHVEAMRNARASEASIKEEQKAGDESEEQGGGGERKDAEVMVGAIVCLHQYIRMLKLVSGWFGDRNLSLKHT